ncbi:hypothetical protein OEZ60_06510 [Defluviimonas sp. WL0024]|uniref:Uncharacterized protein n=1 Tax=Albidovulum salinarum TaxID=2984153 RepID=A0ABT2X1Z2_9RHOB|nr:hypothetical protein [Defluviimonas sp. WL0024]MCU9847655.1 hypothetical protein [Defluviimonas sp. WL0024]
MAPARDIVAPNIFPSRMALCAPVEIRRRSVLARVVICPLCLLILGLDHAVEGIWRIRAALGRLTGTAIPRGRGQA